ncbi:DUF1801 domain-containing protein [Lysobacter sp. N42]|uniref:DUF1801 domain-containing protein n=1 Tax=Lysobacter sp. N42 TaxID=2545719 RepID=UPI001047652E|nr:DUF1801 domain-containing protein [Lysobacter sp. N42]TCZ84253.1 DUF1801 domain-containing protein [Lysobacter sp. N42]
MATSPKTRPTDVPPEAFIAAVPQAARRGDAQAMLKMLGEVSGEPAVMWGPSIVGFGRHVGPTGDWPVIGFSPRKAETVVYLAPDFDGKAGLLARLGPHRLGVSCLYIKRLADVDMDVLRELCRRSVDTVRAVSPRC